MNADYLYRVQHDLSSSKHYAGIGIISTLSQEKYTQNSSVDLESIPGALEDRVMLNYLKKHIDWNNKDPTPYVSATTSIEWALYHAALLKGNGLQNVHILVIRARKCTSPWWCAKEKLETEKERRLYNFARTASEVIIESFIPKRAIIKRWDTIIDYLPSLGRDVKVSFVAWTADQALNKEYRAILAWSEARLE